jgi:squalene-associated FAD-dependent desaturase
MGCCTNLAHFFRTVGVAHFIEPQPTLYFMTPDRRVSTFRGGMLPAPLHLAGSFLRAHYFTWREKLRIAWGLHCLRRMPDDVDPPFREWLEQHGQTPRIVDRFWGLVLVSALNESPDRIGLRYARKVFVDGFLRHRRGFEVEVPSVPLARLYGEELQKWLGAHEVSLQLNTAARALKATGDRVESVEFRGGESIRTEWIISTVPFDRLLDLLPAGVADEMPYFARLRQLETSPITSVHVWYNRPVMDLPHVVLIDSIGQWVFNRGKTAPGEFYLQVVVSAARQFRGLGHDDVQRGMVAELSGLFPAAQPDALVRARVVTEHAATFSAVPGVDQWRPDQRSPLQNLFVAGDWTATGWPATMEGAVRSGYLVAEKLLAQVGVQEKIVQPDL